MKPFAASFYNSTAWKKTRDAYKREKKHLCERCLSMGLYRVGEIVHHIEPLTPQNINDSSISLDRSNLQLLCRECHAEMHGEQRRYKVGDDGRVVF